MARQPRQVQRQVSLRPQASPVQRYTRPAQPQRNQQAEQLASALQSVSPTMGKLSNYLAEKKRKEAEQQAQSEIQQMSMEEAEQLVQSGQMSEYENPYFQEAFQRQYGVRLGLAKSRDLKAKFSSNFNPRSDDVDQFIAENLGVDMGEMSQNPIIEGGFSDAMDETLVSIRDEAAKQQAAAYEQDKLDGIYETYTAEIDRSLEKATTPEERQSAIDAAYQAIRSHYPQNKERLNVSNAEQDAVLMQVASRYAREGQSDVVEKLLTDDRGGVGAIIDKRGKMGAEAAQILSQAEKAAEEDNRERSFDTRMDFFNQASEGQIDEEQLIQWHKDNPGAMTDAKVQSLIRKSRNVQEQKREELQEQRRARVLRNQQAEERNTAIEAGLEALKTGQAHQMPNMVVTNDQGEKEIMAGDEIIEEAKTYLHEQWIPQQVAGAENPEEAAFNLQVDIYSKNPNLVNDQWKSAMENAAGSLSAAAASDGESIPPKLRQGFELYQRLSARNPGLRDSLISEQDKQVYESIRVSQEYMGLDFEQAVTQAYKSQTTQDIDENPSIRARYDEVDRNVAELNGVLDGWGTVKNDSYVSTELRKIGRHIARAGGPTGLEEARKRFKEEHEFINGWAVPTRGQNVPDNFKTLAEEKINEYVEKNPDEGVDAEDISVFPLSGQGTSGVWTLVDNSTGSPLQDRIGSQFTLEQLQREADQKRRNAAEEAAASTSGSSLTERSPDQGDIDEAGRWGALGDLLGDSKDTASKDQTQQPGSLTPEDMSATPEDGKPSTDLGTLNADIDGSGRVQVNQPTGRAKLPGDLDPKVRDAVQKFRDAGITREDFDSFLDRARGEPVRWAGNANNGNPLDTTFAVNPTVREKIRKYLPAS